MSRIVSASRHDLKATGPAPDPTSRRPNALRFSLRLPQRRQLGSNENHRCAVYLPLARDVARLVTIMKAAAKDLTDRPWNLRPCLLLYRFNYLRLDPPDLVPGPDPAIPPNEVACRMFVDGLSALPRVPAYAALGVHKKQLYGHFQTEPSGDFDPIVLTEGGFTVDDLNALQEDKSDRLVLPA